ncbi:CRAL-TRIO domain-containing protein, partial [Haematococcus lacustris]
MGMLNLEPGPVEPADALPDPATHLQARDSLSSASDGTGDVNVATLEAVRGLLAPEFRDVDDATITRFVKATGGHLPLSVKRLQATLTWRRDTKPELVVCRACLQDAKSHYMHLVGYDKQDRPIIYSCLALAKNKVYADNHDHMVQTFEMAIKCMGPKCSQWVWICDFHGFGGCCLSCWQHGCNLTAAMALPMIRVPAHCVAAGVASKQLVVSVWLIQTLCDVMCSCMTPSQPQPQGWAMSTPSLPRLSWTSALHTILSV